MSQGPGQSTRGRGTRPPAGLCDTCAHQRLVRNTRGSEFSLCRRSAEEPGRYRKYPRLPVAVCDGWQAAPSEGA